MIGLFIQDDFPLDMIEGTLDRNLEYLLSGKGIRDRRVFEMLESKGYKVGVAYKDTPEGRLFELDRFIESLDGAYVYPTTEWSTVMDSSRSIVNLFFKCKRLKHDIPITWFHKKQIHKLRG